MMSLASQQTTKHDKIIALSNAVKEKITHYNSERIKEVIKNNRDIINELLPNSETFLTMAITSKNPLTAEFLLENGASPQLPTSPKSAIFLALEKKQQGVAHKILHHQDFDLTVRCNDVGLLEFSLWNECDSVAEVLLTAKPTLGRDVEEEWHILNRFINCNKERAVRFLLEKYYRSEKSFELDWYHRSLLGFSVTSKHFYPEATEGIIIAAHEQAMIHSTLSRLHLQDLILNSIIAAKIFSADRVKKLYELYRTIPCLLELCTTSPTPAFLQAAIYTGSLEFYNLFLELSDLHVPHPLSYVNDRGESLLMQAIAHDEPNPYIIKEIIKRIGPNNTDRYGRNCLYQMAAAFETYGSPVLKTIHAICLDPELQEIFSNTPIDSAVLFGMLPNTSTPPIQTNFLATDHRAITGPHNELSAAQEESSPAESDGPPPLIFSLLRVRKATNADLKQPDATRPEASRRGEPGQKRRP